MSKKLLLTALTCFTVIGWGANLQAAKTPCKGVKTRILYFQGLCPLRVIYEDCLGNTQTEIFRLGANALLYAAGDSISFECVGGIAKTQTVKLDLNKEYVEIQCTGGAWGANLKCQ